MKSKEERLRIYPAPSDYHKEIVLSLNKTLRYYYFLDHEHPLASSPDGIVYYHRHVASVGVGRWLDSGETVHHIDTDRMNNRPENLQVFSSNSEHVSFHRPTARETKSCEFCGTMFRQPTAWSKYCSPKCRVAASRRFEVTKEVLERLVEIMPFTEIGRMFGVSDSAIRKRCKRLGINYRS